MKIKKEYQDREITTSNDFIPGGVKRKLGDLTRSEVKAFHSFGYISDCMLEDEPKATKKKKETPTEDDKGE